MIAGAASCGALLSATLTLTFRAIRGGAGGQHALLHELHPKPQGRGPPLSAPSIVRRPAERLVGRTDEAAEQGSRANGAQRKELRSELAAKSDERKREREKEGKAKERAKERKRLAIS